MVGTANRSTSLRLMASRSARFKKSLDSWDVFSPLDFITSDLFYSLSFKILIMADTSLIKSFQTLVVKDDSDGTQPHITCLPFNPGPDFGISPGKVDRYLFRLFDKHSDGSMDHTWVKSRDAKQTRFHYDTDVFEREDRHEAAQALRRHLQWTGQPGEEDNFVSWSSSLLLVLQYAFYRKGYFAKCNHKLEDMKLCVADTTKLPDGVFLSDTALIEAFSQYDLDRNRKSLPHLKTLRQGQYYFGEYLSQGALCIEECCSIVSMDTIVSKGLYHLRKEFQDAAQSPNQKWAKEVLNLRQTFCSSRSSRSLEAERPFPVTDRELTVALSIGYSYGSIWRLPIALAFLALKPRHFWDTNLIKACRLWCSSGEYPILS